jgi:hypothetical protein
MSISTRCRGRSSTAGPLIHAFCSFSVRKIPVGEAVSFPYSAECEPENESKAELWKRTLVLYREHRGGSNQCVSWWRRIDNVPAANAVVRSIVIGIGLAVSAHYFWKLYGQAVMPVGGE